MAQQPPVSQAVQMAEKARTPGFATFFFAVAAAIGVLLARLLWHGTFSLGLAVSAGAAAAAVLLSAVAFWDCLAALGYVPEVAPFDLGSLPPQVGDRVRWFLPPAALLVGYLVGHFAWH